MAEGLGEPQGGDAQRLRARRPAGRPGGRPGRRSIATAFAGSPESLAVRLPGRRLGDPPEGEAGLGAAGVEPGGDWYVQAGAGMGQVLRIADQKRATR